MPLTDGVVINGYRVEKILNMGAFANAYITTKGGTKYFLKEYKSPKPTVPWYRQYVAYQDELKRRIDTTPNLRNYVGRLIEFFEATEPPRNSPHSKRYYQIHEFVEGGMDLAKVIEQFRRGSSAFSWDQRLIFARVFMAAVNQLHEQKIVHSDLKPENLFVVPDMSEARYRVKVIDMDFSVLEDQTAPWHGQGMGYVQTPGWGSPEHCRGQVPERSSDIFTCALILHDLLGHGNPIGSLGPEEYHDKATRGGIPGIAFQGHVPDIHRESLTKVISRALSPRSHERPSARELQQALIWPTTIALPPAPPGSDRRAPPPPAPPAPPVPPAPPTTHPARPGTATKLTLREAGGELRIEMTSNLLLNRSLIEKSKGRDSGVWDNGTQLTLERRPDGWYAVPPASPPTNETLLNGKAVKGATLLKSGDILAIGREAKNVIRSPLTISIGS